MLTKEIQKIVGKDRLFSGHRLIGENISHLLTHEMDVISVKRNLIYEYEVKISRSDFLADKKKGKFKRFKANLEPWYVSHCVPNYFSYVCPNTLIEENEIPDYAGLFYVVNDELFMIKEPLQLHKIKVDIEKITKKLLTVYIERNFLGKCKMTYLNDESRKRNKEFLMGEVENL